jgi:hypothetical protein
MKKHYLPTILSFLLVCAAGVAAQESVYTSLAEKQCKTLELKEDEAYSRGSCAGVGGYKLEVVESDLRQTVDVVAPNGKKSPLDFQGNVSAMFSAVGQKAEWRARQGKPYALIVRFNVSENPDDTTKKTSYLVVAKISPEGSCITGVVNPSATANADAQRLADEAPNKSCKPGASEAAPGQEIRKIDFANFTHRIGKDNITLKNGNQAGACGKNNAANGAWEIGEIAYGDLDGDGEDEAAVSFTAEVCGGGGTLNDALLVYTYKGAETRRLPELDYADAGCEKNAKECPLTPVPGVGVSFDEANAAIVVEFRFRHDDDPICCPSYSRKTLYKWDGSKFFVEKRGKAGPKDGK